MKPNRSKTNYVPAIDGLRALAVLAVVVFHLEPKLLAGGFLGVDMFFVISGFVVARSINVSSATSLKDYFLFFFKKRFLRIYPALFFFVFIAFLFCFFFVPTAPSRFLFEYTGVSSLLGLSNFLLMFRWGNYFSASSEFNIFTHTWSLAVEEQFYLIFPVLTYFLLVKGSEFPNRRIQSIWAISLLSLASLIVMVVAAEKWFAFSYYMIVSRFWELGIGLLLFVYLKKLSHIDGVSSMRLLSAVPVVGLSLILSGFFFSDQIKLFYLGSIIVSLGTVLVISSVVLYKGGFCAEILSSRLLVHIGKLSYSIYLWHWGVIVSLKWTIGLDSAWHYLLAIWLTLFCAYVSYYFIEDYFRSSERLNKVDKLVFFKRGGGVISILVLVFVAVVPLKEWVGATSSMPNDIWNAHSVVSTESSICSVNAIENNLISTTVIELYPRNCEVDVEHLPHIWVFGDSHAGSYLRMLSKIVSERGYHVTLFTMPGCKFLSVLTNSRKAGCRQHRIDFHKRVSLEVKHRDIVFLPGLYLTRFRDTWEKNIVENNELDTDQVNYALLEQDLVRLRELEKNSTIIFEGIKPIFKTAMFRCFHKINSIGKYCEKGDAIDKDEIYERAKLAIKVFDIIDEESSGNILFWDVMTELCPADTCYGLRGGVPLFFDGDHLSAYGNDQLYSHFEELISSVDQLD